MHDAGCVGGGLAHLRAIHVVQRASVYTARERQGHAVVGDGALPEAQPRAAHAAPAVQRVELRIVRPAEYCI